MTAEKMRQKSQRSYRNGESPKQTITLLRKITFPVTFYVLHA